MSRLLGAVRLLLSNPKRLISRMQYEFLVPSGPFTRVGRRLFTIAVPNKSAVLAAHSDRLLFVYDTLASPITFDFLHYLYYADRLRQKAGKARLDLLIIVRSNGAYSCDVDYAAAVGDDNVSWRVTNLIVPLFKLFPTGGGIYIVDEKEAFDIVKGYGSVHPEGYGYASPKSAAVRVDSPEFSNSPVLTISEAARKIVEAYFPAEDDRRIVTITLRTYDYILARNSDIPSWLAFANELDPSIYRVIFVPDASARGVATFVELDEFEIFDAACWNLELRAALYKRAWMNMGVVCGPLTISALMENVRTIMIDRTLDYPENYRVGVLSNGNVAGQAPLFYSRTCHFYLGKDNKETILKLFNEHAV